MTTKQLMVYLLLIAGDVEHNPGPARPKRKPPTYKFPCGECAKPVKSNQKGIQCDELDCQKWYHTKCIKMNESIYDQHQLNENLNWTCNQCEIPFAFSESFFEKDGDISPSAERGDNTQADETPQSKMTIYLSLMETS
jgi:hypothetical protein